MFNAKYLQIDCIPNTLSPRSIARIPHRTFFPRLWVSHYPQFIKVANSGVVTAFVLLKVQFANLGVDVEYSSGERWVGGKVGSSLHCLQIKSLDGSINPQTVRHNVEKSFLQDFSFSLAKEVFLRKTTHQTFHCAWRSVPFVNTATTPDLVPSLLAG